MSSRILDELKKRILLYDGGMGSLLQAAGLAAGELPETWNILHPEVVKQIHADYLSAGADIINTNTFGANRYHYPSDREMAAGADAYTLEEIVRAGCAAAQEAVREAGRGYVALDLGPTGKLLRPMGTLSFEECVEVYTEVVRIGVSAGVDLITIETMSDLHELKAAVLAAKEASDLPVFATVVFEERGRLLTGGTPEAAAAMLEGLRADAIGVNCGLGPAQMVPLVERLIRCASVPVIVNPNAGLPRTENGRTVYDIGPDEFARLMSVMPEMGVSVMGGCCGTTPAHIRAISGLVKGRSAPVITPSDETVVTGYAEALTIGDDPVLIGERINPTGKKWMKQALLSGEHDIIVEAGLKQVSSGAHALDVNVGMPEIDEAAVLPRLIEELQSVIDVPLQIDTAKTDAMERALRVYNGKPLINSVNGKQEVMDAVFPLAAKYGGVVVGLTLDENGIPATSDGRIAIARRIYSEAAKYGIGKKDILIDCVCMTVSSEQSAALVALDTIRRVRTELKGRTTLGVSNVAFGLPCRTIISGNYLTMALYAGLNAPIMNPDDQDAAGAYRAFRVLAGYDRQCLQYIETYSHYKPALPKGAVWADQIAASGTAPAPSAPAAASAPKPSAPKPGGSEPAAPSQAVSGEASSDLSPDELQLISAVRKGLREQASACSEKLLETINGTDLIERCMLPALDAVGKSYEAGETFLPQMLMSAEAAKAAFANIRESLLRAGGQEEKKGKIILATVKGDIHDIGKNIVKVLLENYGYEVLDLGKDVPPEKIAEETVKEGIRLVGLSALMTTTVGSMEETIRQVRAVSPGTRIAVGGAVLTEEYAKQIGADAYCADAMATVRFAGQVFSG